MNLKHPLILASSSPRRQFLMQEIGFDFRVQSPDVDESFPEDLPVRDVPALLARRKADVFKRSLVDEIVVSADTVVVLDTKILNKPQERTEAIEMLKVLSGRTHEVITAVCIMTFEQSMVFEEYTRVTFRPLSIPDIEYYVDQFKPLDKAGSYGAQECLPDGYDPCSMEETKFLQSIGMADLVEKSIHPLRKGIAAIEKIDGSYFNVMGLPIHKVYSVLKGYA